MRRAPVAIGLVALVMLGATASLNRVFVTSEWQSDVFLSVAVPLAIVGTCALLRLGIVASLAASVVAFVAYLYVVHLPPGGGLVPGGEQWAQFTELFATGLDEVRFEPAPTVPLDGIMLVISSGTFWVTWLVAELLVRLRRPGLALLPATLLWAIPLAVPQPPARNWPEAVPFLAAGALVLLLEADVDVVGWHREDQRTRVAPAGVALGSIAIVVAALAPGLLPGYQQEPWYDVGSANDPRGYQPIVDVGDRLHLPEPRPVLRVEAPRPVYLRLAGLDHFDGRQWRIGEQGTFRPTSAELTRGDRDLRPEVPLGPTDRVSTDVTVLDLENIYVPVPYQPVRMLGPARGEMVYSREGGFVATVELEERGERAGRPVPGVIEGLQYGVVSDIPAPSPQDVINATYDPATVAEHLQLPADYGDLAGLAEQAYAVRGATTPLEKAYALQDHFIGEASDYVYSTDVPSLVGSDALHDFVFGSRTGYCEYYATAMAVMLRATGVPARVAVGFLPGTALGDRVDASGQTLTTYLVTTEQAHAWVEVLQPGFGWIKFDPTPRADGATYPPTQQDVDPLLSIAERTQLEDPTAQPTEPDTPQPTQDPADVDGPLPTEQPPGGGAGSAGDVGPGVLGWLAIAALVTVGGGIAATVWRDCSLQAARPPADRVVATQRRVHQAALRYGVGRQPSETATEAARRWCREGRADPFVAERFATITQAAAFGGDVPDSAGAEAERLGAELVVSLRGSVPARARVLAPVRAPVDRVARTGRDVWLRLRDRSR